MKYIVGIIYPFKKESSLNVPATTLAHFFNKYQKIAAYLATKLSMAGLLLYVFALICMVWMAFKISPNEGNIFDFE